MKSQKHELLKHPKTTQLKIFDIKKPSVFRNAWIFQILGVLKLLNLKFLTQKKHEFSGIFSGVFYEVKTNFRDTLGILGFSGSSGNCHFKTGV